MNLQVIGYRVGGIKTSHSIEFSKLSEPKAFDMYDVNIINLQCQDIWTHQKNDNSKIDSTKDFESLKTLISTSQKYTLIALPQNYTLYWFKKSQLEYHYNQKLKDNISNLQALLLNLLPQYVYGKYSLIYENSYTKIDTDIFSAAFSFKTTYEAFTKSIAGNHPTTIKVSDKVFLTTLDICSKNCSIDSLLCACKIINEKDPYPDWLYKIDKFDDSFQKDVISENNAKIQDLIEQNKVSSNKLDENMKYKSILVTNGTELVKAVFEILEKMLSYDLSSFKDENKEDFLIHIDNLTFIGEIKGVTSNVKSEHISQLDVHYQGYIENLPEDSVEIVRSLLIINPFRNKPLEEREPIHSSQIKLAVRNESLIITTEHLLNMFEKFSSGQISTEQVKNIFTNQTGLIDLSSI